MDAIIGNLLSVLFSGGPHAVTAVLGLVIIALYFDRRRLISEIARKELRLDKIIEDYHSGNMTIAEAMMSLKNVLSEIRAKL